MPKDKTITINGRVYDAATGMPVEKLAGKEKAGGQSSNSTKQQKAAPKRSLSTVTSSAVHSVTQRSQTLQRRAARKSTTARKPKPGRHMDIARSSQISRFAPRNSDDDQKPKDVKKSSRTTEDAAPKPHPVVTKALSKQEGKATAKPAAPATAKQIKDAAIAAALAPKADEQSNKKRKSNKGRFSWKKLRPAIIIAAILIVVGGGLYVTYISVPSLSVRYAAIRAGIKAKYPEYKPDGYSLKQPVTYSDGQVNLVFQSNSGSGEYTVTQTRSSWDSTAVLDNIVKKEAGENYITTQERGLTIYSYDKNTAWVNGGVLFQIENDTLLSGEQIRRIATSL